MVEVEGVRTGVGAFGKRRQVEGVGRTAQTLFS